MALAIVPTSVNDVACHCIAHSRVLRNSVCCMALLSVTAEEIFQDFSTPTLACNVLVCLQTRYAMAGSDVCDELVNLKHGKLARDPACWGRKVMAGVVSSYYSMWMSDGVGKPL